MKKSKTLIILLFLVVILGTLFTIRLISGDEDTWLCEKGTWVKHGNPSATMPTKACQ